MSGATVQIGADLLYLMTHQAQAPWHPEHGGPDRRELEPIRFVAECLGGIAA
jgi:hypothetical protein